MRESEGCVVVWRQPGRTDVKLSKPPVRSTFSVIRPAQITTSQFLGPRWSLGQIRSLSRLTRKSESSSSVVTGRVGLWDGELAAVTGDLV